jgi:hypothetical protein
MSVLISSPRWRLAWSSAICVLRQSLGAAEVHALLLGLLDAVHLALGADLGLELGNRP